MCTLSSGSGELKLIIIQAAKGLLVQLPEEISYALTYALADYGVDNPGMRHFYHTARP